MSRPSEVGAHPMRELALAAVVGPDRPLDAGHAVAEGRVDLRGSDGAEHRRRKTDGDHDEDDEAADDDAGVAQEPRPHAGARLQRDRLGRGEDGGLDAQ